MSKPIFVECLPCGERWKVGTTPAAFRAFARLLRNVTCPNCYAKSSRIVLCMTDGPHAVTEARNGKPQPEPT